MEKASQVPVNPQNLKRQIEEALEAGKDLTEILTLYEPLKYPLGRPVLLSITSFLFSDNLIN